MADNRNILAGIKATGPTGTSFAFFAPEDTPIPTDLWSSPLPAAWRDAGNCDTKGLTIKRSKSTTDIKSYGSFDVQRTLTTEDKKTGEVTFQETNTTALEVYNGLPLGSLTVGADGTITVDANAVQGTGRYAVIFLSIDGDKKINFASMRCEATGTGDLNLAQGQALDRPVTLTFYPGNGFPSLREQYVMPNLATAAAGKSTSGSGA